MREKRLFEKGQFKGQMFLLSHRNLRFSAELYSLYLSRLCYVVDSLQPFIWGQVAGTIVPSGEPKTSSFVKWGLFP